MTAAPVASSAPSSAHDTATLETPPSPAGHRATLAFAFAYSPVWMAAIGALMLTRKMAAWGNAEHMLFGIALALPPWIYPFTPWAARAEPGRAFKDRYATHFAVAVFVTTMVQTYFGSALFFDRLGMEYHFHTTQLMMKTPVFLYFVTIAYFTTYYAIMLTLHRPIAKRLRGVVLAVATFALCYAIAFGETFFMASDLIKDFFSYRDRKWALVIGSIGYGILFFCTLPVFVKLATTPVEKRSSLGVLTRDVLAANMVSLCGYELFAYLTGKPFA